MDIVVSTPSKNEAPASPNGIQITNVGDKLAGTVYVVLERHAFGVQRKIPSSKVETDARLDMVGVTKKILSCPEYQQIKSLDNRVTCYLRSQAHQSPIRDSVYILPMELIEKVDNQLLVFQQQRQEYVNSFLSVYESAVTEAKEDLKSLYEESDYPTVDAVRSKFGMTWHYLALNVPDSLQKISAGLLKREREKMAAAVDATLHDIQDGLRAGFVDFVDWAVSQLGTTADGKTKRLHASKMDAFRDFLDTFEARNLTDDSDLEELVKKSRALLQGIDPETLKKSKEVRQSLQQGFQQIQSVATGLVETNTLRGFSFEDEE